MMDDRFDMFLVSVFEGFIEYFKKREAVDIDVVHLIFFLWSKDMKVRAYHEVP